MPTGSAGSPIGRRPSGSRNEAGAESWTVRPLYGASQWVDEACEGGTDGAHLSSLTATAQLRVDPAFSLVHPWSCERE